MTKKNYISSANNSIISVVNAIRTGLLENDPICEYDVFLDVKKLKNKPNNLWKYKDSFPPLNEEKIVSFFEGFTPLLPILFLGKKIWVKQEQLFSTGSYKDRGASLVLSHANSLNIKHVVQDSSGNAGCAIAAYAALAKMACDIYVPKDTAKPKIKQIKTYGAQIHQIDGDREATAKAALRASKTTYYASHCYNPYFFQGTKTLAFEICEQLGWKKPDSVVVPAGNGTLVLGLFLGFYELMNCGIINSLPKIIAIQAEHCAPLFHQFHQIKGTISFTPTIAEGIAIKKPVRLAQMVDCIQQSKGNVIVVSENDIKKAHQLCGRMGFYIETTSAATIAGLLKYIEETNDETIVSLFSGHGLKK